MMNDEIRMTNGCCNRSVGLRKTNRLVIRHSNFIIRHCHICCPLAPGPVGWYLAGLSRQKEHKPWQSQQLALV